jgi:hypothetical protein
MEFRESPTQQRAKEQSVEAEVVAPKKTTAPVSTGLNYESVVYYLTGLVELVLGIRLIMALTDPNGSGKFIDTIADPLTRPFYELFGITAGHEPSAGLVIMAMVVYGFLGWGVGRLLRSSNG